MLRDQCLAFSPALTCVSLWILSETMKSTTLAGDALVSVATIPLLVGVLAMKTGAEIARKVGQSSEDIFQGRSLTHSQGTAVSDNLDSSQPSALSETLDAPPV